MGLLPFAAHGDRGLELAAIIAVAGAAVTDGCDSTGMSVTRIVPDDGLVQRRGISARLGFTHTAAVVIIQLAADLVADQATSGDAQRGHGQAPVTVAELRTH